MNSLTHPTVTIGIPAHNEENNIAGLLQALLSQRQDTISIRKIVVVSDGSTDRTVEIVKACEDPRVRVIEHTDQHGKSARLNEIFQLAGTNVVVTLDADVLPATQNAVEMVCRPFLNRSFQGFAAGKRIPLPSHSLTGNAVANVYQSFDIVRNTLAGGKSLYSFFGGIWAISSDFAKTIHIPPELHCDDNYVYLTCKQKGYSLSYQPDALVYFRTPQTIQDQIRQGGRFGSSIAILSRYFDPALIVKEFHIPFLLRLKMLWYQITHDPLAYIWLKILWIPCILEKRRIQSAPARGIWKMISSSKKL